jgi:hypothetical protein
MFGFSWIIIRQFSITVLIVVELINKLLIKGFFITHTKMNEVLEIAGHYTMTPENVNNEVRGNIHC